MSHLLALTSLVLLLKSTTTKMSKIMPYSIIVGLTNVTNFYNNKSVIYKLYSMSVGPIKQPHQLATLAKISQLYLDYDQ